jgi:hypothetical protein
MPSEPHAVSALTSGPIHVYLACRLTLDALCFIFLALTVLPGRDAIANAAGVVFGVSALVAPYGLLISLIILGTSARSHPMRAILAGIDSVFATAVMCVALKALT